MSDKSKPKKSSVRHTRAIQRDRTKRPNSAPPDEQIEARLTDLIHPTTYAQVAAFHALGLRERILTLPVMMAFVLSLIWRHLGSVTEATRVLREGGVSLLDNPRRSLTCDQWANWPFCFWVLRSKCRPRIGVS